MGAHPQVPGEMPPEVLASPHRDGYVNPWMEIACCPLLPRYRFMFSSIPRSFPMILGIGPRVLGQFQGYEVSSPGVFMNMSV